MKTNLINLSGFNFQDNFVQIGIFIFLSTIMRLLSTLKDEFEDNIYILLVYQTALNLFYTYIIILFVIFLFQINFMVQYKDFNNLIGLILLVFAVFTSRETKIAFFRYIVKIITFKVNKKIGIDDDKN